MDRNDTRRINWPWRILMLVIIGPSAVVATGLAIQLGHPELIGERVTDDGQRVVVWAPSPGNDAEQLAEVWCQSVAAPTADPRLAAHLAELRASERYAEQCASRSGHAPAARR